MTHNPTITCRPSLARCFTYTVLYLTLILLIPLWVVVLTNTEPDGFTLLVIGSLSLLTLLFVPPLLALFMRGALTFHLDDESVTLDSFDGLIRQRMPFSEIKGVRWFGFVNLVSRGIFTKGVILPSLFLLDAATREKFARHLREHLDDMHPLVRMAK